jgi:hypothetical protein
VSTISGGAPERRAPEQGFDVDRFRATQETADESGWAWAPYAPEEPAERPRYRVESWAPASAVRHPWVRVGRFTLLYRRAA